jgi:hypothetical protein
MAFESSANPLDAIFGLIGKKLDYDQQRAMAASSPLGANPELYGVDEYGRVFLRGTASTAAPMVRDMRPILLIGAVLLAAALAYRALKR